MKRIKCKLFFFFVNGEFLFSGCTLQNAEKYGDFLVYPKSHFEVWDTYDFKVDYDYYPSLRTERFIDV